MKLNSQDLEKITDLTLDYYNRHAEDFWEGTRNHDVSQNIAAMLQHIQGERPFTNSGHNDRAELYPLSGVKRT